MPRAISETARLQAVQAYEQGAGSVAEVAARFEISRASLVRFLQAYRAGESLQPVQEHRGGRAPILDDQDLSWLADQCRNHPQVPVHQLAADFAAQRQKRASLATIRRGLKSLGIHRQRPSLAPLASATASEPSPLPAAVARASPVPPSADKPHYQPHHRRNPGQLGRVYPSDLTDEEWHLVQPLVEGAGRRGRPFKRPRRDVLNALFYQSRTGCQWRMLPKDFPPWQTVYSCFRRWQRNGLLDHLHNSLREWERQRQGREVQPSAAIIDSQSVKTTEKGGPAATMAARRSRAASATSWSTPSVCC